MNRLLPATALLLALFALLTALLLWREVRGLRSELSQRTTPARISDQQFALVKEFVDTTHKRFDAGTVPRADVLVADQFLVKARFMHGDISQAEWHRSSVAAAPEIARLHAARISQGAGTMNDLLLCYDDLLESAR